MSNLSENVSYDRLEFDVIKKGFSQTLGHTSMDSLNVRVTDDMPGVYGRLVEVSFDLLVNKLVDDRYSVYFYWDEPRSWWQHFKKDMMPRWFLNKYPVKYTKNKAKRTVRFKRYAEYPKANVAIQRDRKFFVDVLGGHETIRDVVNEDKS